MCTWLECQLQVQHLCNSSLTRDQFSVRNMEPLVLSPSTWYMRHPLTPPWGLSPTNRCLNHIHISSSRETECLESQHFVVGMMGWVIVTAPHDGGWDPRGTMPGRRGPMGELPGRVMLHGNWTQDWMLGPALERQSARQGSAGR